jgi:hypothetical protein
MWIRGRKAENFEERGCRDKAEEESKSARLKNEACDGQTLLCAEARHPVRFTGAGAPLGNSKIRTNGAAGSTRQPDVNDLHPSPL